MSAEKWLPVPLPGLSAAYEVSDRGRVRSKDRDILTADGVLRFMRGRLLTPSRNNSGEFMVKMSLVGEVKSITVKKLVMDTFAPPGVVVLETIRHRDGSLRNNRHENLYYAPRGKL